MLKAQYNELLSAQTLRRGILSLVCQTSLGDGICFGEATAWNWGALRTAVFLNLLAIVPDG